MKKTKKLFLFALAVTLFAVVFCFSASALEETGQCGDNVTWNFNSETGELVISGTGEIYSSAFIWREEIKTVEIKTGVTSIGEYAFCGCTNIESIIIPDGVTSIGENAFDFISFDDVIIPRSVTSIGSSAFGGAVKSITILNPDCYLYSLFVTPEVDTIYGYKNSTAEAYAISNAKTFKVYCLHENTIDYDKVEATCTTDGRNAGTYCSDCEQWLSAGEIIYASHTDVNTDKICDACGEEAIFVIERGQCGDYAYYKLFDNGLVVIYGKGEMWGHAHWTGSEVYYSLFKNRAEIKTVTIENGITNIGSYLFENCANLISVNIPGSLTTIGAYAFFGAGLKEVIIPEGVVEIGNSVFKNCVYLEKVVIPATVMNFKHATNVNPRADKFQNCIRLSEIIVLNPQCELTNDINTFPENATLYGYEGSTLQTYAEDWNRKFVVIGSEEGGEGEVTPDTPDAPHTHKFPEAWSVITTASCTQDGVSIRLCEGCNIFETQIEEAYGHADNNGDGKCDECKVILETAEPSVPSEPSEPEAPETEKEDANVFSFLTEFLNKLIDFLKSLFKIG